MCVMGRQELRKALAELRVGTHLKVATFARVAGLNRITVERVEDQRGYPNYNPSYETISKWLTAAKVSEGPEAFILEHTKKTAKVIRNLPDNSPEAVHTLPSPQLVGDTSDATHESGSAISAEAHAAILEQLAFDLFRTVAALRGVRTVQPATHDEHAGRRADDPLVDPNHVDARRVK